MCACVCISLYIYIYIYIYIHISLSLSLFMYTHVYVYMHLHICKGVLASASRLFGCTIQIWMPGWNKTRNKNLYIPNNLNPDAWM